MCGEAPDLGRAIEGGLKEPRRSVQSVHPKLLLVRHVATTRQDSDRSLCVSCSARAEPGLGMNRVLEPSCMYPTLCSEMRINEQFTHPSILLRTRRSPRWRRGGACPTLTPAEHTLPRIQAMRKHKDYGRQLEITLREHTSEASRASDYHMSCVKDAASTYDDR